MATETEGLTPNVYQQTLRVLDLEFEFVGRAKQ